MLTRDNPKTEPFQPRRTPMPCPSPRVSRFSRLVVSMTVFAAACSDTSGTLDANDGDVDASADSGGTGTTGSQLDSGNGGDGGDASGGGGFQMPDILNNFSFENTWGPPWPSYQGFNSH